MAAFRPALAGKAFFHVSESREICQSSLTNPPITHRNIDDNMLEAARKRLLVANMKSWESRPVVVSLTHCACVALQLVEC